METFERKEIKYLLTPVQYIQFRALAEGHLAPAEYYESNVCSVYYDTPEDTLVNRSLAGGKYKEKLRIRLYGPAAPDASAFVEIKKKFKGITYKRRVNCTLAAAKAFLGGMDYEEAIDRWPLRDPNAQAASLNAQSLQIAREIAWMRDHYAGMAPKMEVCTHRLSFVDADDSALRITFDAGVHWQKAGEQQAHGMFPNGERILEVKCGDAYPLWLVAALNECGARPQSVSKYGRAYVASMADVQAEAQAAAAARVAAELAHRANRAPAHARTSIELDLGRARALTSRVRKDVASAVHAFTRKPAHAAQR